MPRGRKANASPDALAGPVDTGGIGVDPEAEATAKATAESPEGEALFQELKRMEVAAHTGADLAAIVDGDGQPATPAARRPAAAGRTRTPVAVVAEDDEDDEPEPWMDEEEVMRHVDP